MKLPNKIQQEVDIMIDNIRETLHNYEDSERLSLEDLLDCNVTRNTLYHLRKRIIPENEFYQDKKYTDNQGVIFHYLKKKLGHYAASPKKGTVQAIKATYIFNHTGLPPEKKTNLANYSKETTKLFTKHLIRMAREVRSDLMQRGSREDEFFDTSTEKLHSVQNRTVLLGEKGIGKTTFLNYIISVIGDDESEDAFDHNKVILIRVDLNKKIDSDLSLAEWLKYKICRIVYRYYHKSSYHFHGRKWCFDISENNEKLLNYFQRIYKTTLTKDVPFDSFTDELKKASDLSGTPFEMSHKCFTTLYSYLLSDEEVSFILTIDGLDLLSLDQDAESLFKKRMRELQSIFQEQNQLGAYVVVLRTTTYDVHLSNISFDRKPKLYFIEKVDPESIYNIKVEHLTDERILDRQKTLIVALSASDAKGAATVLNVLCEQLILLVANALYSSLNENQETKTTRGTIKASFDFFKKLFGDNNRGIFESLIKVISFALYYFGDNLAQEIITHGTSYKMQSALRRRYYVVLEAILLGDEHTFYHSHYFYKLDEHTGKISRITDKKNSMIMNVFNYPVLDMTNEKIQNLTLVGVRILQFLQFHSDARICDLQEFISVRFKYDKALINAIIDELIFNNFIDYSYNNWLILSDIGAFVLDSLIYNATYLNFVTHSTPLFSNDIVNNTFLLKKVDDPTFAAHLIKNAVNFARTLRKIEQVEQEVFLNNRKESEKKRNWTFVDYNGYNFSITFEKNNKKDPGYKLFQSIIDTAERIINTAAETPSKPLYRELTRLFLKRKSK